MHALRRRRAQGVYVSEVFVREDVPPRRPLRPRQAATTGGRHPAGTKLAYLSRHLARRERFDEKELGLRGLATRALLATLDEVEVHRIALRFRVRLEAPRLTRASNLLSSQYLCGSCRLDSSHVIHETSVQDAR
jgi:hypothetical protein